MNSARRSIWFWGLFLGFINFCGSGFQQWGISMTSASKVAFIAGFDLFLTPVFALFIPTFKQNAKPTVSTWIAVSISMVGLFLLSDASLHDFVVGRGETLTFISTFFW
jgi:drug/metabolite transporter (DMT)-like permease